MATSDSREVVIEATPDEIFAVVADVESTPTWSPQYQKAEVVDTDDEGRPRVVKQTIKTVGITDVLTVEYTWEPDKVSWELVKASQLKSQKCSYTLTPLGGTDPKTRVRFDITVELAIPLPGFILKKVMKGALDVATDGLRKEVLRRQKQQ
ncbi:SRPBCC family protein [Mycolicibacterium fluoranthenivorans]|jgi:ribosome-associated toxin RatA of RatAB toxin-antitoxin module|uniref:Ribosome association toxin PasT (RatA) of the RatAB toxin-antitoxin module n=1 Tax=Mycolicibacterium fluoranthenivorans TaxID=258505 RepID=A0A1G4VKV2_9MYCO|nr:MULTISPECIES: SRPBCC family protein [Mycobacteriaceae]MCV7254198.1 SRPBCC family protein [Mycobacterium hackensackense]QNJ92642.1 SRPBCC family protein [Mycolicibacterium fluoranthenivorans]SCX08268.1 Ribosome association toxin PasT (RatA) of the RatAB toxin-antitoxin module [Mycolicibacterium fluoranthenivorans]